MKGWTFSQCHQMKFAQQRLSSQFEAVIVFNGNHSDDKDEHENDNNY